MKNIKKLSLEINKENPETVDILLRDDTQYKDREKGRILQIMRGRYGKTWRKIHLP